MQLGFCPRALAGFPHGVPVAQVAAGEAGKGRPMVAARGRFEASHGH